MAETSYEGFELGTPVLVCRWRMAGARLPLENRHLRALGARSIAGTPLSTKLIAWAKQHIEWTLTEGAAEVPDGVLMLAIDEQSHAAMSVGPYEPLADTTADALIARATASRREAEETGVAPEILLAWKDETLVCCLAEDEPRSGIASLVVDLATTLKTPLAFETDLASVADNADELALASDEHGIVAAQGFSNESAGDHATRLNAAYLRLLDKTRDKKDGPSI